MGNMSLTNISISPELVADKGKDFLESLFYFSGWLVEKVTTFLIQQDLPYKFTPTRVAAMGAVIDVILIWVIIKFAGKLKPLLKIIIIILLIYLGAGFFVR